VTWVSTGGNWTVHGGVKNLTDEVYRVEGQEFRSVGGIQTAYYGRPLTWTIGVDYRY
jgi:iron complex outermembrane receptor protein